MKGIEYANSMHRCCSLAVLDKLLIFFFYSHILKIFFTYYYSFQATHYSFYPTYYILTILVILMSVSGQNDPASSLALFHHDYKQ